jgi:hypothetical protein
MRTIETSVTVAADGFATVDEPLRLPAGRHRVVVLVDEPAAAERDERGWPVGFFEDTYGSFADDPLRRPEQGDAQEREALG